MAESLSNLFSNLVKMTDMFSESSPDWEFAFNPSEICVELNEEEQICNFILGLFPDVTNSSDLAEELVTYFEDIQINAKARSKSSGDVDLKFIESVIQSCEFFLDCSEELAKDVWNSKKVLRQRAEESISKKVKIEMARSKRELEVKPMTSIEKDINRASFRFHDDRGVFHASRFLNTAPFRTIEQRCNAVEAEHNEDEDPIIQEE